MTTAEYTYNLAQIVEQSGTAFMRESNAFPEFIKNSADSGIRRRRGEVIGNSSSKKWDEDPLAADVFFDDSDQNVVVLVTGQTGDALCLDFAGAPTLEPMYEFYSHAASGGGKTKKLGGNGNGGKFSYCLLSSDESSLESVCNLKLSKMEFGRSSGLCKEELVHLDDEKAKQNDYYKPKFATENGMTLNSVACKDAAGRLSSLLSSFGLTIADLPPEAQIAFKHSSSYTAAVLRGGIQFLAASELEKNDQIRSVLEVASVFVGGKKSGFKKLVIQQPALFAGSELSRISIEIAVPMNLLDPDRGNLVATGADGSSHQLVMNIAKDKLDTMDNVIRYKAGSRHVARVDVKTFVPALDHIASMRIFGEISVPNLSSPAHLKGSDRTHLEDTKLVRAIREFVSEEMGTFVAELVEYYKSKSTTSTKDLKKAQDRTDKMAALMSNYLNNAAGSGSRGNQGKGPSKPTPGMPTGTRVDQLVLENGKSQLKVVAAVDFPIHLRAKELNPPSAPKPVHGFHKDVNFQFSTTGSSTPTCIYKDSMLNVSAGVCDIQFDHRTTAVKSNLVTVQAIDCNAVNFSKVPMVDLYQQDAHDLVPIYTDAGGGAHHRLVGKFQSSDSTIATVDQFGRVSTKSRSGSVDIHCHLSDGSRRTQIVTVGSEVSSTYSPPKDKGGGAPIVLLCGSPHPVTGRVYPADEDGHTLIMDDPMYVNTILINGESAYARAYRENTKPGHQGGAGSVSSKTSYKFVGLQIFEATKIYVAREDLASRGRNETEPSEYQAALGRSEVLVSGMFEEIMQLAKES